MSKLSDMLKSAAQEYYTAGTSKLSDEEFDKGIDQLKKEEPDNEILNKVGWGYNINVDTTPGSKVNHKYSEIGSLDKCRTWKELGSDFQNCELDASLKLDGISVVLYYVNGNFIQALTRGDGKVGIDITDKVKMIEPEIITKQLNEFTGGIRGEILMSFKNFDTYITNHPEAKNPRNTVAGLINSKDISDELKLLDIIVYTIIGYENSISGDLNIDTVRMLLSENFKCVPYKHVTLSENNYMNVFNELKSEWYGKYPADGVVITLPTIHHNFNVITYDAKAFKFQAEQAECEVTNVNWELSKTRYMIPTIQIKPVSLSGTTVSFITGYNAKYIKDNKIGIGSKLIASKHGEIIPNVDKVLAPGDWELPHKCPECNSTLIWNGVHLQCPNTQCDGGYFTDLIIWSDVLSPIDGLGEKLRRDYYKIFWQDKRKISINVVMSDKNKVYELRKTTSRDTNIQLNKFIDSLITMFESQYDLITALKALNIPRFGDKTCEKLAQYPNIVKRIYDVAVNHKEDTTSLIDIYGYIGDANADALILNLDKFANIQYIWDRIMWPTTSNIISKGKVAITGKLSVKRSEFEKELKSFGYSVGDMSKTTKYLITDDPTSNSVKNIKATEWGITKITEQEFRDTYMKENVK